MNEEHQVKSSGRQRSRSHPTINLAEATEKAAELLEATRQNWTHLGVAAEIWGFKKTSSLVNSIASALRQYGLAELTGSKKDRRIRASDRVRHIHKNPNLDERQKAKQDAALNPSLFTKLWDEYGPDLPLDSALRWELIENKGLSDSAADAFISNYKATIEFAGLKKSPILSEEDAGKPTENGMWGTQAREQAKRNIGASVLEGHKVMGKTIDRQDFDLPIYLSQGRAILRMPVPMTSEDFEKIKRGLSNSLEALKENFVQDDEPEGEGE